MISGARGQRLLEIGVGAAIAAGGLAFALAAARLPESYDPSVPGPGVAPGALGLLLVLCGLALAGHAALRRDALAEGEGHSRKALLAVALVAGCAVLLEPLGFMASTFLFLTAGFTWLGEARPRIAAAAAAVASLGLWLFFTKLLGVGLPYGLIGDILFR